MSILEFHIAQIMRRQGWQNVIVNEAIWTSKEWLDNPVKLINGPFLIVEFYSWHTGSATPDGNWLFSGGTNSAIEYNKGNTPIFPGASATEVKMHSHFVSQHQDRLTYTVQPVEPSAYSYVKIITLQKG